MLLHTASTADSILFSNGLEFSATNPEVPPLLTINVPLGLQYGATPGNISLDRASGTDAGFGITVSPSQTIALVGGDLNLQGASLEAPGGRIELGSVMGEGLVGITPTAQGGWQLGYEDLASFGDIQTTRSFISTSIEADTEFPLQSSDGTIAFRAASLDIGRSSVIRTNTFTDFPGGNINIDVQNLTIRDGAAVGANTFSNAPGGDLTVNASETVELKDSLNFGQFVFLSSLSTSTGGFSSNREINRRTGNAGNLTINTKRLILETGGSISTASFSGGNAGNLLVNVSELVQLNGTTVDNEAHPSILAASTSGIGNAGNITVITPNLQVENGAVIRSGTTGNSDAGNIILQVAEAITLTGENSGIFANTAANSSGNGGSILIEPTKEIKIQEQAQIAVDSEGSGQGGNIELKTDFLTLDRGFISAETASNQGGNLALAVDNLLLLRNESNITATAGTLSAGGDGGNINLNTNFLLATPSEDNNITANAFTGQGGNVQITAQGVLGIEFRVAETSLSDITASSQFGLSGTVVLNIPDVDVISSLVKLPDEPIDVQLSEGCRATAGQGSSFVRTGKGGLPSSPDDLLESTQILDDLSLPQGWSEVVSEVPKQIVQATGWIINEEGTVELVAQKPDCL